MADDTIFMGAKSDWLSITKHAYSEGSTYFDSGVRLEIEQAERQFQGKHPSDSKYLSDAYKTRARFFRPKTRATIRKNEAVAAAAFFSNTDVVEVTPWDDGDPVQRQGAALHKELLSLRLQKFLPWFMLSVGAYQDAMKYGVVWSHQRWKTDPKRQIDQPEITLIPIENMIFSPGAQWFDVVNTSPYLIRKMPMFVKDVRARMVADPKTGATKWMKLPDEQLLAAVRAYSDSITLQREGNRADPQAQASALTSYQKVWVYENIADVDGEDFIWYSLADIELLTKGKPLADSYWHGLRPYTMGVAVLEAHKVYPPGVPRLTKDIQGEINQNANQRIDVVSFAMNKRYFVKRGAQVDLRSLSRNVPGSSTLMGDPTTDVVTQEHKDVIPSAYQEQDRLNNDFDEIAGTFSRTGQGDRNDLSNKLGGAEMLSEDANQIEGYQLRTFAETWMEPTLYQIMRLEQHYETDPDILRLCGRKAGLGENGPATIDDNLLMQDLSVTVHVGIGATSPRKQLENLLYAFKSLKEMLDGGLLLQYGLDVEELIKEVFGKLGYRGGERFFQWDNQDPNRVALTKQIQDLQQQLQNKQKDPPEIVAQKVELLKAQIKKTLADAFNVNVEGLFGSMQAAEVVAAVPAVGPVADTIAQAAGYEVPTPPGVDPGIAPGQGGVSPVQDAVAQGGGAAPVVPGAGAGTPAGLSFAKNGAPVALHTRNTGINMSPGGQPALPPGVQTNTSPLQPAVTSTPDFGAHKGIEGGR